MCTTPPLYIRFGTKYNFSDVVHSPALRGLLDNEDFLLSKRINAKILLFTTSCVFVSCDERFCSSLFFPTYYLRFSKAQDFFFILCLKDSSFSVQKDSGREVNGK